MRHAVPRAIGASLEGPSSPERPSTAAQLPDRPPNGALQLTSARAKETLRWSGWTALRPIGRLPLIGSAACS